MDDYAGLWPKARTARRSNIPDSKVHGANMGPTWVLSAPDGPHGGPMNLAIRDTRELISTTLTQLWLSPIYKIVCVILLITIDVLLLESKRKFKMTTIADWNAMLPRNLGVEYHVLEYVGMFVNGFA